MPLVPAFDLRTEFIYLGGRVPQVPHNFALQPDEAPGVRHGLVVLEALDGLQVPHESPVRVCQRTVLTYGHRAFFCSSLNWASSSSIAFWRGTSVCSLTVLLLFYRYFVKGCGSLGGNAH